MIRRVLPVIALSVLLAACATHENDPSLAKAWDSVNGKPQGVESRLTTAAAEAIAAGRAEDALPEYRTLYIAHKNDAGHALNYAQLLRRTGNTDEAIKVLTPFIKDAQGKNAKKVSPLLVNEYAAALIEQGKLTDAQKILDLVLTDDAPEAAASRADAMNLLGVSLDAQGRHKEAETMFRLAIEGWNGNPTTVMNNLALCLANQARFDEALTTLRQALVMAPDKQPIASNIQMVQDLRDSVVKRPVSLQKN